MKNTLLVIICIIAAFTSKANDALLGLYEWNVVLEINLCNIDGDSSLKSETILSEIGQKFRVVGTKPNQSIIMIENYGEDNPDFYTYNFVGLPADYKALSEEKKQSQQFGDRQAFFLVDTDIIQNTSYTTKTQKIGGNLAIGLITLPYKFRPQSGINEFEGSFNFGVSLAYHLPRNSFKGLDYSIAFGVHHTSVNLDSISVGQNSNVLNSTNNYSALSFSLGFLVEYEKIQIGLFVGIDKLNRNNQEFYNWQYQSKPWVSLAFGTSIFSSSLSKPTNNN